MIIRKTCVYAFVFYLPVNLVISFKLNILTVIVGQNPIYGLQAIAPAYDVALDLCEKLYPDTFANASRYSVYKPGNLTCDEAAEKMYLVVAEIWDLINNLTGFTVIFSPEWNIPVFSSTQGFASAYQLSVIADRFPTVVSCSPSDHVSLANSARHLIDMFSWQIMTFLCDSLSQYPSLNIFYIASCHTIQAKMQENTVHSIYFDSHVFCDYASVLQQAAQQSRIILIFSHPRILRDILVKAYDLKMTEGDFVFLAPQLPTVPMVGKVNWKHHDLNDDASFEAYRSLITFSNPDPNWNSIQDLIQRISDVSRSDYNVILHEKLNVFAVSAYEAMAIFSEVLTESCHDANLTGRSFARRFWTRTFTLPTRNISMTSRGSKTSDICFCRLNSSSGNLEEAWRFYSSTNTFAQVSDLASVWPYRTGPPPDKPSCGFLKDLCDQNAFRNLVILTLSLCLLFLALIAFAVLLYRKRHRYSNNSGSLWWLLDPDSMTPYTAVIEKDGIQAKQMEVLILTKRLFLYHKNLVWVEFFKSGRVRIESAELKANKQLRHLLNQFRSLHHENIGIFYGIAVKRDKTYLLHEYGLRGSLRALIANENFEFDFKLRGSIIWELLTGLRYIQDISALGVHGMFSSLTTMINDRFCTKLCGYGTPKILGALIGRNVISVDNPARFWMAPELLVDAQCYGTKPADIYSLGVVLSEIITRKAPLNANLEDPEHTRECLLQLGAHAGPRFELPPVVTPDFARLVLRCSEDSPEKRPPLHEVILLYTKIFPPKSILDSLLFRLESYSNELETLVATRTNELEEEREKINALLSEMIPATFIPKLRNKEVVEAEYFDCVTVLFSDFPQFEEICTRCSPMIVTSLLNRMYIAFDSVIGLFDVYKVETIKDSYMVASGLPIRNGDRHAAEIARLALAMLAAAKKLGIGGSDNGITAPVRIRIGINSGPCAAGIVGSRMPRYCLFGDTVNTASRMESHGEVDRIHTSLASKLLVEKSPNFQFRSRGVISIKGKGETETFWLHSFEVQLSRPLLHRSATIDSRKQNGPKLVSPFSPLRLNGRKFFNKDLH